MRGHPRLPQLAVGLGSLALAFVAGVLLPAAPAAAHPLGNFSVNQTAAITLTPGGVRVAAVINTAEIPTRQERAIVDGDADGRISDAESKKYAGTVCSALAAQFHVDVDGRRLAWRTTPGQLTYEPGAAGLSTARLTCTLDADAGLTRPSTVTVANLYRADRLGWNELTAVGDHLRLVDSPLPSTSPSNELRTFPASESPSTLSRVRTATLHTVPGEAAPAAVPQSAPARPLGAATGWAQERFERLAAGHLTPIVVILAILLALLLGAGHAVLPGHGKTAFAAYLAGRDGRPRDAVTIGAAVTLSHTGSVLVVGLLISAGTAFAAERILGYLGLVSGLLVSAVGCAMVVNVIRRRQPGHTHIHGHTHGRGAHGQAAEQSHAAKDGHSHAESSHLEQIHDGDLLAEHGNDQRAGSPALVGALATARPESTADHTHSGHPHGEHAHDHSHGEHEPHGHSHKDHTHEDLRNYGHPLGTSPAHTHAADHTHGIGHTHGVPARASRWSLAGLGLAGGLVPSPSALIVLLAAVGLGRAVFGVVLVVAYGIGMAGTLTAAGLLLLALRRRLAMVDGPLARLSSTASALVPVTAAALVVVVGAGLTLRAMTGLV